MGIVSKVRGGKPKQTTGDAVVTRLVEQDTVSWIRKPNLRSLYFLLVPAAIGIEITSGFDSQLINALQIVPTWIKCEYKVLFERYVRKLDAWDESRGVCWWEVWGLTDVERADFHNPQGSLKGIIAAAYSLGAIISLPFIPWVDNKVGRRGSIMVGSAIMVIGAIIQGMAQNVTMYIFARLM
jgi:MFS family permease